ncbi:MAG: type II toxin-antitoxin system VapC family toxin [Candidatus Nanopelagicales bacterium]|nr:type II toxin-antitoxin system VapC family toxin [Candidatus Nanopelagicales bacterium]MDZ4249794.1 type II toxin-antitoxin system VapC family toxin [Candidatus Nanopelagicales bacterium]
MKVVYADASALVKLLKQEGGSEAVAEYVEAVPVSGGRLVASAITRVELHRVAIRRLGDSYEPRNVEIIMSRVDIAHVSREHLELALNLRDRALSTLDSVHLATAITLGVSEMLTFDRELRAALSAHGIKAVSPGSHD